MLLDGIEAVIFDFDGTLYEAKNFEKEIFKTIPFEFKKLFAAKKNEDDFRGKVFESESELKKSYFEALGEKLSSTSKEAENWYERVLMGTILKVMEKKYLSRKNLNNVYSVLKHKKIKIAVLGDYPILKAQMEVLGIYEKLADEVFYPQKLGGFKPAPQILQKIAESLEVEPSKILVVGDENYRDGEGARSCGMKFVQIKTKKTKETPQTVEHPLLNWDEFTKEVGI